LFEKYENKERLAESPVCEIIALHLQDWFYTPKSLPQGDLATVMVTTAGKTQTMIGENRQSTRMPLYCTPTTKNKVTFSQHLKL